MHLLNTETIRLEPRTDKIKRYSILSHRWEQQEVLFEHITGNRQEASQLKGYAKVLGACERARGDGYSHIWLDTCCIDKRSSSELSEAINSMFAWYREASICYAYLSDVSGHLNPRVDPEFEKSKWFERGWTLQELIAPTNVTFFSSSWKELGKKTTLRPRLAEITGIDEDVLAMTQPLESVSVAKRMSWAAKRTTTRLEDQAYSLMGLFNVNMPMIYGEGKRAFIRLQEEIMKDSADETLFAWRDLGAKDDDEVGLLATSPKMFEDSGQYFSYTDWEYHQPFSMTNRGLKISLPLRPLERDVYVAALNCPMPGKAEGFMGILLRRITAFDDSKFKNQYARVRVKELVSLENPEQRGQVTKLHVRQTFTGRPPEIFPQHTIQVRHGPNPDSGYTHVGSMGVESASALMVAGRMWIRKDVPSSFKLIKAKNELAAVMVFRRKDETEFAVLLGSLSSAGDVGIDVLPEWGWQTFNEVKRWFVAQPPEQILDTGKDWVVITSRPVIKAGVKYFVIDISIEMKPSFIEFLLNQTALRQVINTIPEVANAVNSKDSGAQTKASGIRSLFKSKTKS